MEKTEREIHYTTKQKGTRGSFAKAFKEKLYSLEPDFMPWIRYKHKRLRNILKQKTASRRKRLRNGKLF